MRKLALGIVIGFFVTVPGTVAGAISELVLFGDSLSDTGNVYSRSGSYGYPGPGLLGGNYTAKKFTNGTDSNPGTTAYSGVWHERMATILGVPKATNSIGGGTNWAFGGAITAGGTQTISGVTIDNLGKQVDDYLAQQPFAGGDLSDKLFVMWAGGNDLINAAQANGATAQQVLDAGSDAMLNLNVQFKKLADAGAKQFLWVNLPPVHATPRGLTFAPSIRGALEQASNGFAAQMPGVADGIETFYGDVEIHEFDVLSLFNDIQANPTDFGYTNVTASSQGKAVNPDDYLFWDDIHPTTKAHNLIGIFAAAAVPEPATVVLMMIGVALLRPRRGMRRLAA